MMNTFWLILAGVGFGIALAFVGLMVVLYSAISYFKAEGEKNNAPSKRPGIVQQSFQEYVFLCSLHNDGRPPPPPVTTAAFVTWHGADNLARNILRDSHPPQDLIPSFGRVIPTA